MMYNLIFVKITHLYILKVMIIENSGEVAKIYKGYYVLKVIATILTAEPFI